jgi:hypothetical protein
MHRYIQSARKRESESESERKHSRESVREREREREKEREGERERVREYSHEKEEVTSRLGKQDLVAIEMGFRKAVCVAMADSFLVVMGCLFVFGAGLFCVEVVGRFFVFVVRLAEIVVTDHGADATLCHLVGWHFVGVGLFCGACWCFVLEDQYSDSVLRRLVENVAMVPCARVSCLDDVAAARCYHWRWCGTDFAVPVDFAVIILL